MFSPKKDKHIKVLRSLDSVKTSINQDLMNQIYFRKIVKKNQNKKISTKNLDIKTETSEISNETFNNFKNLQKILKNQIFVLNYDQIHKKMQEASASYNERLFDYSDELRRIEMENKRGTGVEDEILEKYLSILKEIKQKISIEKQIRMMNYMNNKKINTQKENVIFCLFYSDVFVA